MGWLLSVYIGATILGAGVTVFDLLGMIGSHEAEGGDGHDGGGHEAAGDHDVAIDHDGAEDGGASTDDGQGEPVAEDAGYEAHESADHEGADASASYPQAHVYGSMAGHDRPERRSIILTLLTVMRSIVYFSLGFGPVGWFSLATSGSIGESLAWSVPVGVLTIVGTRALRRFMRRELNSEVRTSELLFERGQVTVSIGKREMGRVRVRLGDVYVERFARSADPEVAIRVGTRVRVSDVSDECVYVEPDE